MLGSCLTSNGEGMGIERSRGQEKVEPMLTLDCAQTYLNGNYYFSIICLNNNLLPKEVKYVVVEEAVVYDYEMIWSR